jgi:O-antigen/teichoic acid export membrane protein
MTGAHTSPVGSPSSGGDLLVPAKSKARQSRLTAQLGWVAVGRLAGALIQAVTLVLVARWAGPAGFGVVGIALSVVVIVQTATDLGLPTYLMRERAARPDNPTIRRALQINNFTAKMMSVLLALILFAAGIFLQPNFFLLLPMALWAAADRNTDTWLGVTFADGDVRLNVAVSLSRRTLVLAVLTGLYFAGVQPLLAFSLALAAVSLAVNIFVHRLVVKRLSHSDEPTDTRAILRAASSYWLISVSAQLRNLDAVIIGAVTGTVQVAFYAAALKTTSPLRILPNSLGLLLVPAAARSGADRLRPLAAPVLLVFSILLPMYGVVIVAAPWLVPWAFGQEFAGAILPLQIICAGLIFGGMGSVCSSILQGLGKAAAVARVAVVSTVGCLLTVLLGAIAAGAAGAAIAVAGWFLLECIWLLILLGAARRAARKHRLIPAGDQSGTDIGTRETTDGPR